MSLFRTSALVAALLTLCSSVGAEDLRTWKDATGKFELRATLVKIEGTEVRLRKEDGREVKILIEKLSADDREFLAKSMGDDPFRTVDERVDGVPPVVAVSVRTDKERFSAGGLVFAERDGQTYVVFDRRRSAMMPGMETITPAWEVVANWANDKQEPQKVKLELVTNLANGNLAIARGPAKDLPAPIKRSKPPEITEGMKVRVIGYQVDDTSPSFSLTAVTTTVSRVFKNAEDKITRALMESSPEAKSLVGAVVVNDKNQAIGVFGLEPPDPGARRPPSLHPPMYFVPLVDEFAWEQPRVGFVSIYPASGDEKKIVWNVLLEYWDPMGAVEKPLLLCERQDGGRSGGSIRNVPFSDQATRIELKQGKLTDESAPHVPSFSWKQVGKILTGTFETTNPLQREHPFTVQFGYETKGKEPRTVWLESERVTFNPNRRKGANGQPIILPNVPGIDGLPLDLPRAISAAGGYQITTEQTVPKQEIQSVEVASARGKASKTNAAGELRRTDKVESMKIGIAPQVGATEDHTAILCALSADGEQLYLVDRENVLHCLDANTLQGISQLKLPAQPSDLQLAKSSLLVSFHGESKLWRVTPRTLEKVYEYAVPAAAIGASPGSDMAFVAVVPNAKSPTIDVTQLWVLDASSGKVRHVIKQRYGSGWHQSPLGLTLFEEAFRIARPNLVVTASGNSFLMQDKKLRRFRIENEDLILEEIDHSERGPLFVVAPNADGSRIVLLNNRISLGVFEGKNLKEPSLRIAADNAAAAGFDPRNGRILVINNKEVKLLTPQAELVVTAPLHHTGAVRRILPDPRGDRFIACAHDAFYVYDFKIGRLGK